MAAHRRRVFATFSYHYGRRDGQDQGQGWCRELPHGVYYIWGSTYGFIDLFANIAYVFDVASFTKRPDLYTIITASDRGGRAARAASSSSPEGGPVLPQLDDSARAAAAGDVGEDGPDTGRLDGSMGALPLSGVVDGEVGDGGSQLELSSSSSSALCPLVVGSQARISGPASVDFGIASMRATEALFVLRRPGAILRMFFRLLRGEGAQPQAAMEAEWEKRIFRDAFLRIGAAMFAEAARPVGREEEVGEGGEGVLVAGEGGIEGGLPAVAVAVAAVEVVEEGGEGGHGLQLEGEVHGADNIIVMGEGGIEGRLPAAAAAVVAAIGNVVEEGEGLNLPASSIMSSPSFSSSGLGTDSESSEEDEENEE
jgi:hypothetical protein